MSLYAKAIIALFGALATWGITAAEDNTYTQVELWGAILALSTAVGVYLIPNKSVIDTTPRIEISERGEVGTYALLWGVVGFLLGIVVCKLV